MLWLFQVSLEDEFSLNQHMKSIAKEMDKQRPNITTLKDLMTRTVSLRDDIFRTAEVLNKGPFISIPSFPHEFP